MISIPLLLNGEHPCSYLEQHRAQSIFVHPHFDLSTEIYAQLVEQGFRRSGDNVYAPRCQQCSACIPVRLRVPDFKANRSQKRCLQNNADTKVIVKPAVFEQQHYDLYCRYQTLRHGDGAMADASPEDYINFLGSSWCDTVFVEFSIQGTLAGVAIVDQLPNALSAVYTFFDPQFSSYSLGTYAVLWQIAQAQLQRREFVYLGFWINACQKMAYKSNYRPLQQRVDGQWLTVHDDL
ncbi:putative arginyl-tRNA--protein transferase [Crenothrix polyspora]|uniref:Aspartate/glutamate leucyltransferase n=1 Tax=Crenothrix polyspora TaxID=360316 RepID=A0A1R4HHD3_9GAMM|nr:arginyltransferase [Crenothrix polyspora]SJM95627.1 putative arginyl-tRNA--protein transferase [Crenothrix polyspora]